MDRRVLRKTGGVRSIYLLRHAKAGWGEPGIADHDRPLDPAGVAACANVARYLEAAKVEPDLILCSSAVRARNTMLAILPGLPQRPRSAIEEGLYLAPVTELLDRLSALDDVGSVMLIGHNPGLEDLIQVLTSRSVTLPPAGLATLTAEGDRSDLGDVRLASVVVPSDL